MKNIRLFSALVAILAILASCQQEFSSTTGTAYNDPQTGGFQKVPFVDQETGPGLVLLEGGTFTMGRTRGCNVRLEQSPIKGNRIFFLH